MATPNFGWIEPIDGGSAGTWGTLLNDIFDAQDTDLQAVKDTADAALPKAGGVMTGQIEVKTERYATVAKGNLSGAVTMDFSAGSFQRGTVTGNVTSVTFTNFPASGKVGYLTLELTNGGAHTITWPGAVKWDGDGVPTLRAAGVDVLVFYSRDNGVTIRGFQTGSFAS